MSNVKVFILNGPKLSGKDTIAGRAVKELFVNPQYDIDGFQMEFKAPLYDIAAAIYGLGRDVFYQIATDRDTKEKPMNLLKGKSPRDVMIEVSEKVIKPAYGKDYFGQRLVDDLNAVFPIDDASDDPVHVFVSDGGFNEEIQPVVDRVGKENVFVVNLYREGCTFEGDSRDYVDAADFGCRSIQLYNDSTVDAAVSYLLRKAEE